MRKEKIMLMLGLGESGLIEETEKERSKTEPKTVADSTQRLEEISKVIEANLIPRKAQNFGLNS